MLIDWMDSYDGATQLELGLALHDNVLWKRNVSKLRLNRPDDLEDRVSVFIEFQMAGAEHKKIHAETQTHHWHHLYMLVCVCDRYCRSSLCGITC